MTTPTTDEDEPGVEYEELRPEMSRGRKVAIVVVGIVAVLAVIVAAVAFWSYRELYPSGNAGAPVVVDIPTGSSTTSIADLLEKKGVIKNAFLFKAYLKVKGAGSFQAGQYTFRGNERADDVVATLKKGPQPPPSLRFTVQPGLNLSQVTAKLVQDLPSLSPPALDAVITGGTVRSKYQPEGQNLEGFLFPDTYELGQGADENAVVKTMVTQFDRIADQVGLGNAQSTVGYDPYQALTVASMVEAEAKVDEDRPKIARVIYNRLAQGIPLGVDATLCYLKSERPCVLHQSELAQDTPYNTRINAGLPPTPIMNVSQKSLEAALHPDQGDELYYVLDPAVDPSGQRHLFTSSASEFAAAKARCAAAGFGCG